MEVIIPQVCSLTGIHTTRLYLLSYVVLHYILLLTLIQKIYYKMTIVIDDTLQMIKFIADQYVLRF